MKRIFSMRLASALGFSVFFAASQASALTGQLVIRCQKTSAVKASVPIPFSNDAEVLKGTSQSYGQIFGSCKGAMKSTTMKASKHTYNGLGQVVDAVDYTENALKFSEYSFSVKNAPFTGQTLTCICNFSK